MTSVVHEWPICRECGHQTNDSDGVSSCPNCGWSEEDEPPTTLDDVLSAEGRYEGVHVRITVDTALFGSAPWATILIACKRAAAAWAHIASTADRARRGKRDRSYREEAHLLGLTREGLWKWRKTVLCDPVDLYGANPGRRPQDALEEFTRPYPEGGE